VREAVLKVQPQEDATSVATDTTSSSLDNALHPVASGAMGLLERAAHTGQEAPRVMWSVRRSPSTLTSGARGRAGGRPGVADRHELRRLAALMENGA
jgi:hypothetical protein